MAIVFFGKLSVQTGLVTADPAAPARTLTVWRSDIGDAVVVIGPLEGALCPVLPRSTGLESLVGFASIHARFAPQCRSSTHVQWFLLDGQGLVSRLSPTWERDEDWRPSSMKVMPLTERDDMVEVVRHLAAGCLPPISISFECATAAA